MTEKMTRQQWWEKYYRENRYMVGLTNDELDLRFADVLSNSITLTQQGKLSPSSIEWTEAFTHLLQEYALRGLGLPAEKNDVLERRFCIPKPGTPALGAKIRAVFRKGIPEKFTLFKYGKREHLEPLLHDGSLRLCPGSYYSDPSLNVAITDTELELEKIVGHDRLVYRTDVDFYCFCSALIHHDRYVGDFDADSVLVVRDPHEFFVRLATALDEPDFDQYFQAVMYIDPLLLGAKTHITDLALVKHMRFAYQHEHRFIAKPRAKRKLEVRQLTLGQLDDIADIYVDDEDSD